jgi:hypothetical protein
VISRNNHPSGAAEPSRADELTQTRAGALRTRRSITSSLPVRGRCRLPKGDCLRRRASETVIPGGVSETWIHVFEASVNACRNDSDGIAAVANAGISRQRPEHRWLVS